MKLKQLLQKRISKTATWVLLFFLIVGIFTFIIIDESCTFHFDKLIDDPIQTTPTVQIKKSPQPYQFEEETLDDVEKNSFIQIRSQHPQ
jgi:ABC-type lipoprotein release transport system permease subunit